MPPSLGTLYLVPAPLDFGCESAAPLEQVLPQATLQTAAALQYWVCENAKSTRAYLKRIHALYPLCVPLQAMQLQELPHIIHKKGDHQTHQNPAAFDAKSLLQAALQGHDVGLVSEAGMPAIADPGSSIVRAAHDLGIRVVPLVGPISLLLALAASGLNGQNFAFIGYLPSTPAERVQRIRELESLALKTGQAQIFIETPYRNTAVLQSLLQTLQHNTRLATASGLTLVESECRSDTIKNWKRKFPTTWTLHNNQPAVFVIGR